jgi:hypothetical protein
MESGESGSRESQGVGESGSRGVGRVGESGESGSRGVGESGSRESRGVGRVGESGERGVGRAGSRESRGVGRVGRVGRVAGSRESRGESGESRRVRRVTESQGVIRVASGRDQVRRGRSIAFTTIAPKEEPLRRILRGIADEAVAFASINRLVASRIGHANAQHANAHVTRRNNLKIIKMFNENARTSSTRCRRRNDRATIPSPMICLVGQFHCDLGWQG